MRDDGVSDVWMRPREKTSESVNVYSGKDEKLKEKRRLRNIANLVGTMD
jgi:hypothetical protein